MSSCSSSGMNGPSPPAAVMDTRFVVWGILLCEAGVSLIALGACIQRFGLTRVSPSKTFLGCSCATAVWFSGLLTYFVGNILITFALALAPASLCAALLATVVVINAALSRIVLKERLQRCDYHGGALITGGIVLASVFAPQVTITYNADRIGELITDPSGAIYATSLVVVICVLASLVLYHERATAARAKAAAFTAAAAAAAGLDSSSALALSTPQSRPYIDGIQVPRTRPCDTSPRALAEAAEHLTFTSHSIGNAYLSEGERCSAGHQSISISSESDGGGMKPKRAPKLKGPAKRDLGDMHVACTMTAPSEGSSIAGEEAADLVDSPSASASDEIGEEEAMQTGKGQARRKDTPGRPRRSTERGTGTPDLISLSPPASPPPPTNSAHETTTRASASAQTVPMCAPSLSSASTTVAGSRKRDGRPVPATPQHVESPRGGGAHFGKGVKAHPLSPKRRPRGSWLTELMPFAYPVILGTLETLVQMLLKAASSMALLTLYGDNQLCHATFWVLALALLITTLLVIWWLRKGLSHLEASRLLPVEYGTVTSTSIVGGLVIYQEAKYITTFDIWMMMLGILLMAVGCGLVGQRRTIKKKFDPGYQWNHKHLPRLRAQMAAAISFELFQLEDRNQGGRARGDSTGRAGPTNERMPSAQGKSSLMKGDVCNEVTITMPLSAPHTPENADDRVVTSATHAPSLMHDVPQREARCVANSAPGAACAARDQPMNEYEAPGAAPDRSSSDSPSRPFAVFY